MHKNSVLQHHKQAGVLFTQTAIVHFSIGRLALGYFIATTTGIMVVIKSNLCYIA